MDMTTPTSGGATTAHATERSRSEAERQGRTVLWLSAHPEPRSLGGSLRDTGIARLRARGHEVLESDLDAMRWDPVLRPGDAGVPGPPSEAAQSGGRFDATGDLRRAYIARTLVPEIRAEQAKLRAADAVVVQFPLWWYAMPAILKGWFDRVFVSGFAFGTDPVSGRRLRSEQGRFAGTRALAVITLGDRPQAIGPRGISGELQELQFGLLHGTFAYTGMSVLPPWALPSADRIEDAAPAIASLAGRLDGLFHDAPLPYRPRFTGDYSREGALEARLCPGETGLSVHLRS